MYRAAMAKDISAGVISATSSENISDNGSAWQYQQHQRSVAASPASATSSWRWHGGIWRHASMASAAQNQRK